MLCLEWDRFPTEELQLEEAAEAQSGAGGGALAEGAESPGRPRYLVSDSLCEMFPCLCALDVCVSVRSCVRACVRSCVRACVRRTPLCLCALIAGPTLTRYQHDAGMSSAATARWCPPVCRVPFPFRTSFRPQHRRLLCARKAARRARSRVQCGRPSLARPRAGLTARLAALQLASVAPPPLPTSTLTTERGAEGDRAPLPISSWTAASFLALVALLQPERMSPCAPVSSFPQPSFV